MAAHHQWQNDYAGPGDPIRDFRFWSAAFLEPQWIAFYLLIYGK
jgi:hypothetical protein